MCEGEKRKVVLYFYRTTHYVIQLSLCPLRCGTDHCDFIGQVVVPPELGYGDTGAPPDIPPNAVLVFELDLVKIDHRHEL